MTHRRFGSKFKSIIFKLIIQNSITGTHFKLLSLNVTLISQSTLVQLMVWCHETTNHYLNQCWLRSVVPYMELLGYNELKCGACSIKKFQTLKSELKYRQQTLNNYMFTIYVTFMLKTHLSSHYVIKCLNSNYHMMRKCWTPHGENLIKLLFHKRVGNLLSVMNYDGVFIYNLFRRSQVFQDLTLCGLVMPYADRGLDQHWLR